MRPVWAWDASSKGWLSMNHKKAGASHLTRVSEQKERSYHDRMRTSALLRKCILRNVYTRSNLPWIMLRKSFLASSKRCLVTIRKEIQSRTQNICWSGRRFDKLHCRSTAVADCVAVSPWPVATRPKHLEWPLLVDMKLLLHKSNSWLCSQSKSFVSQTGFSGIVPRSTACST